MADDPLQECPVCAGHIRRVVNSVGVVFKGKGFYITDSRGGKNAALKTNGKDSTAGSETETTSTKEGESKSEKPAAAAGKAENTSAQTAAST